MGSQILRDQLKREGFKIGRKHVGILMVKMGKGVSSIGADKSVPDMSRHPSYDL